MIEYETGGYAWHLIFRWKGSVLPSAFLIAFPSAILSLLLVIFQEELRDVRIYIALPAGQNGVLWTALTALMFSLIGYRTTQALARFWEGTSLLHAMRGEWFDSASCLATFSLRALKTKPEEVMQFRQTLLRLMSLCHGSALDEIRCMESENYEVLDINGLDEKTLKILRDCKQHGFNRVEVILHMIQVLVITAEEEKIIQVPPPILSRVYQTLSRGFVHLLSAKKIRDTRYPFPYAQLIAVLMSLLAILTPFVMSAFFEHSTWCALATFLPIFTLYSLNYTAEELEMPYGDDANDLPLAHFQQEMNSSLLMLIHEFSDHVAHTTSRAAVCYDALKDSLAMARCVLHNTSEEGRHSIFSQLTIDLEEDAAKDFEGSVEDPPDEDPPEDFAGAIAPPLFPERANPLHISPARDAQMPAPQGPQQPFPPNSRSPPRSPPTQEDVDSGGSVSNIGVTVVKSTWGGALNTMQQEDETLPTGARPLVPKLRLSNVATSGGVAAEPSTIIAEVMTNGRGQEDDDRQATGAEAKPLRIHNVNRMRIPQGRLGLYTGKVSNP